MFGLFDTHFCTFCLKKTRSYAQRNGGRTHAAGGKGNRLGNRGSNIRGISNLQGTCDAKLGGG